MNRKQHDIVVTIRTDDAQSAKKAQERLHAWIETFGHTAAGHGFEFLETKRVSK